MTLFRTVNWARYIVPAVLLVFWEIGVRLGVVDPLFFPAPSVIFQHFFVMLAKGSLFSDFIATATRVCIGVSVGGGIGLFVGLAMGWNKKFNSSTGGIISMAHPLPKISLLPLFFVLFGYGDTTMLILVGLTAFFPMVIASRMAFTTMDAALLDVCRNYDVKGFLFLRRMILPACKPLILTGLQLAINTALIVALSIEMLGSNNGLGSILWSGWQTMRLEDIYVALFVIALVGILVNSLIFKSEGQ